MKMPRAGAELQDTTWTPWIFSWGEARKQDKACPEVSAQKPPLPPQRPLKVLPRSPFS